MMSLSSPGSKWIDLAEEGFRESGRFCGRLLQSGRCPGLGALSGRSGWLQVPFSSLSWTTRLILQAIGPVENGAYGFAWGFGFFQFLFEFGASSALQRQISDAWTRGDRDEVDRAIACGMNFYTAMAIVQIAALLGWRTGPFHTRRFRSAPIPWS